MNFVLVFLIFSTIEVNATETTYRVTKGEVYKFT